MRAVLTLFVAAFALQACGGGGGVSRSAYAPIQMYATGPINTACMKSDRKARNPRLCGCVQAVANQSLSNSEQRLAVTFFKDPHRAQEIRQSDRPNHERMWRNYKAFAGRAEQLCRGL
ncbi:hypothetical protein [Litorisediminicola beolgyonensis]|uniref:Arginine transporter n=1 Tax=Litorisediminicola beolgyonensis TaxID=1173614 RepID=A0ABW3ZKW8_9RHOB